MQNVLLVVELLIALALIGIVLLQRSEGAGGLGMGGGGGGMSGRSPQTALGRLTWYLGLTFFAVALALTIVEALESGRTSLLDRVTDTPAEPADLPADTLGLPSAEGMLPNAGGAPATPPADDTPVTPPAAE